MSRQQLHDQRQEWTLSEIALGMRRGAPVAVLGGWRILDPAGAPLPGLRHVDTPEEAVAVALRPRG